MEPIVKSVNRNQYVTVDPRIRASVDGLPDGYREIKINGEIYYEFEDTLYVAFINNKGEVMYELVEK